MARSSGNTQPEEILETGSKTEPQVRPAAPAKNPGRGERLRPKTLSHREMVREERRRQRSGEVLEVVSYQRPATRADCANSARPCLYVACKHHLYLDVTPGTGSIKFNFPDLEVWQLRDTCALDVAERGGATLEEVGEILNLTRERVRQVEVAGLQKLRAMSARHDLTAFIGWDPSQLGALGNS